jgi:hypothetical protein
MMLDQTISDYIGMTPAQRKQALEKYRSMNNPDLRVTMNVLYCIDAENRPTILRELQKYGQPTAPDPTLLDPGNDPVRAEDIDRLPNLWLLHPRNLGVVRGKSGGLSDSAGKSPASSLRIALNLLLCLALWGFVLASWMPRLLLQFKSITTQAEVIDKGRSTHTGAGNVRITDLYILYRFRDTTRGRDFDDSIEVNSRDYDRVKIGDQVDIVYSQDDPTLSRIIGMDSDLIYTLGATAVAALLTVGLFFNIRSRRKRQQADQHKLSNGNLRRGTVIDALANSQGTNIAVGLMFRAPDGALIFDQQTPALKDKGQSLPPPGATLLVLCGAGESYQIL